MSNTTPAETLHATIAAAVQQYEQDTAPAIDDTEQDDPLSRSYLRWLAKWHDRGRAGRGTEQLIAHVADEFSLLDARILRAAAEVVTSATPEIILKHVGGGMTPAAVAREIGLTESRVYGIIREARKGGWTGDVNVDISNVLDHDAVDAYLTGLRASITDGKKDD